MTELEKAAERISFLYEKIIDNQDWEISELDELLDLSRKDGIEWQAKQSPWISVEERLPDRNDNLYIALDTKMNPRGCSVCDFDVNNKRWIDNRFEVVYPTHWMPIPETP